jgi:lambda repressor-like predicted transcriptional regulator
MSMAELASRYGLPFSLVRQCLEGGYLREASADRLACGLGRHPAELWPDWFPAPLLAR